MFGKSSKIAIDKIIHPAIMYDTKAVANYFLNKAKKNNTPISPLKLQQLMYLAHGWHLAFLNKPLINEPIQAGKQGPYIASLAGILAERNTQTLYRPIKILEKESNGAEIWVIPTLEAGRQSVQVLRAVWKTYSKQSGETLRQSSTKAGSPWEQAYRSNAQSKAQKMLSSSSIRAWFTQQKHALSTSNTDT